MKRTIVNIWWGPPKKFSNKFEERKISWLELFYDLVYVIAISRITHYVGSHLAITGLIDYTYLFIMIYWGWLNGSFHHDLHGSTGVRTNLLTLWQMMIVAALVVTLSSSPETIFFNATIAIMAMQLFITYLWWSVGIYDKEHRKLNVVYTVCYLISFGLMFITLFVQQPLVRILFYVSLVFNYLPAFLINRTLLQRGDEFRLSDSMTERLGLFTIIVFGEVVLGVINGVIEVKELGFRIWVNFGLAILIVFSLWWIFFSMIADKKSKSGFLRSNIMALAYIPTLMALALTGVAFSGLFTLYENHSDEHAYWIRILSGMAFSIFLIGIVLLSQLLDYPTPYKKSISSLKFSLLLAALFILVFTMIDVGFGLLTYLIVILITLQLVILVISKKWFFLEVNKVHGA